MPDFPLIADATILKIPILENKEPLIDLKDKSENIQISPRYHLNNPIVQKYAKVWQKD